MVIMVHRLGGCGRRRAAAQPRRGTTSRSGTALPLTTRPYSEPGEITEQGKDEEHRPFPNWLWQRAEAIIWALKNQLGLERRGGPVNHPAAALLPATFAQANLGGQLY